MQPKVELCACIHCAHAHMPEIRQAGDGGMTGTESQAWEWQAGALLAVLSRHVFNLGIIHAGPQQARVVHV